MCRCLLSIELLCRISVAADTSLTLSLFNRNGNLDTYNEAEVINWLRRNCEENLRGFMHIYVNGEIAGQLEFRSPITELGEIFGYIYLIIYEKNFEEGDFVNWLKNMFLVGLR